VVSIAAATQRQNNQRTDAIHDASLLRWNLNITAPERVSKGHALDKSPEARTRVANLATLLAMVW
jgi:hypothetical protein